MSIIKYLVNMQALGRGGIGVAALTVGLTAGCREAAQRGQLPTAAAPDTATLSAEAVRLTGITVATATVAPWRDAWTLPARLILDPNATEALGSIAEGRIRHVSVRVGDSVHTGQVLVALHSHEMMAAQSDLAKARAGDAEAETALRLAASELERAERLHALKALSLADLQRARAAHAQAQSLRAEAAAELDRANAVHDHLVGVGPLPAGVDEHDVLIRSPLDGIVVSREAQPGNVVLVGAPLVTVSSVRSLILTMALPEQALGAVRVGGAVRFTVPAYPGEWFRARVTRVAPTLDSVTRTLEAQALVLDGIEKLRAQMYATAEVAGAIGTRAVMVPAAAIQAMEGDTVVITGTRAGTGLKLEAVRVRVGRQSSEFMEIVSGVMAGTPVVNNGAAVAKAELLRRRGGA